MRMVIWNAMLNRISAWRPLLVATALLGSATAYSALAGEGNAGNPRVLPPQSNAHGQSYGEWSAAWWQWALSIPAATNPMLDPTGENAALGQSGSVWFLAGNNGGESERTVTVPAGKALFFPVINYVYIICCGDPPANEPYTDTNTVPPTVYSTFEAYVRSQILTPTMNSVVGLGCTVDGQAVDNLSAYRCQSPAFMVQLPEGNVFGIDPGTYGPGVADGYYLMLPPLSAGKHTIHFLGGYADGSFSLDVTYHLTVK